MTVLDRHRVVPRLLAVTLAGLTVYTVLAGFALADRLIEDGDATTIAAVLAPIGVLASALAAASAKTCEYLGKAESQ